MRALLFLFGLDIFHIVDGAVVGLPHGGVGVEKGVGILACRLWEENSVADVCCWGWRT